MKRFNWFNLLVVLALLAGALTMSAPMAQAAPDAQDACTVPVFINEFHYDNAGTDAGEFVEVSGPAGTDLTGWTIVLYNGNNGASYNTLNLSGTIDDESSSGYGAVSIAATGMQNGAPDGLALVNASNAVIQFLSYEGAFAAVGGPADGMSSTDVGVAQAGSEPADTSSLHLTGAGSCYTDFSWEATTTSSSPDSINTGQTFGDPAPRVTSVVPADAATDVAVNTTVTLDFSEAVNATANAVSLDCGGAVTFAGLPANNITTLVLTPTVDLPGGTACTGTVTAAEVTDVDADDPPDAMGSDFSFGFTTFAADSAPAVLTSSPADLATGVAYDANIVITYTEAITATAGWFDISCLVSGAHSAVETAANPVFTLNPDADFVAGETCTVKVLADHIVDQDLLDPPDAMAADYSFDFTVQPGVCGDPAVAIHTVQGNAAASSFVGASVALEGIVVGDYQGATSVGLKGFYLQEEAADSDADPNTSEGVFVLDGVSPSVAVAAGDQVRVFGVVKEDFSLTEVGGAGLSVTVCSSGNLITPTLVTLPVAALAELEKYESMLVVLTQTLTVNEYFNLDRYGEILLSQGGREFQFTHSNAPDIDGYSAFTADFALRTLTLDDGRDAQNLDPIFPAPGLSPTNPLRGGDTVTGLTAVMDYRYSKYRLQPVGPVSFTSVNPRPENAPVVGGSLRVASANTLNYFTTISTTACGPTGGMDCRGADNATEYTRQLDKLTASLCGLDADIIGLNELENINSANDPEAGDGVNDYVLKALTTAMNANPACSGRNYTFEDTTFFTSTVYIGYDAIRSGFIYDSLKVDVAGTGAALYEYNGVRFMEPLNVSSTDCNRPAVAMTFEEIASGQKFTAVINHLKSKGSACGTDGDAGDGQGNASATRAAAVEVMMDWLKTDPTASGDADFLIMGDLNSYAMEDTLTNLQAGGYTNLLKAFHGNNTYSYLFGGQFGYLDHAVANESLFAQVTGIADWKINADEADALDYNTDFKSPSQITNLYAADEFRSSDHDPLIVGLKLTAPIIPIYLPLITREAFLNTPSDTLTTWTDSVSSPALSLEMWFLQAQAWLSSLATKALSL